MNCYANYGKIFLKVGEIKIFVKKNILRQANTSSYTSPFYTIKKSINLHQTFDLNVINIQQNDKADDFSGKPSFKSEYLIYCIFSFFYDLAEI